MQLCLMLERCSEPNTLNICPSIFTPFRYLTRMLLGYVSLYGDVGLLV